MPYGGRGEPREFEEGRSFVEHHRPSPLGAGAHATNMRAWSLDVQYGEMSRSSVVKQLMYRGLCTCDP